MLQKLNLGVSAWVSFNGDDEPGGPYWSHDIGYAKIGGSWGIGLRRVSGHYQVQDSESFDWWLFNDAPRSMRVDSIEKLPDLLEMLGKEVEETTKRVHDKLQQTRSLATVLNAKAPQSASRQR